MYVNPGERDIAIGKLCEVWQRLSALCKDESSPVEGWSIDITCTRDCTFYRVRRRGELLEETFNTASGAEAALLMAFNEALEERFDCALTGMTSSDTTARMTAAKALHLFAEYLHVKDMLRCNISQ